MERAGERFAELLAEALAGDIAAWPPEGSLVRLVVRWSEPADPLAVTVHALGSGEQTAIDPSDAWLPLRWPNVARELERADRVRAYEGLREARERIEQDDGQDEEDVHELGPDVIVEVVRRLPGALAAAGVAMAGDAAITAAHVEGYGARAVLDATADRSTLVALDQAGLLPDE